MGEKSKNLGPIMKKAVQNKLAFYRDKVKEKQHSRVKEKVESLIVW